MKDFKKCSRKGCNSKFENKTGGHQILCTRCRNIADAKRNERKYASHNRNFMSPSRYSAMIEGYLKGT